MQALRQWADRVLGSEFDRALRRAQRRSGPQRFLFSWNRGVGDVGLGLTPYFQRIRRTIADPSIEVVTRADLADAFRLAEADAIHVVPGLVRGTRLDLRAEARRLGVDLDSRVLTLANPDLRRWAGTVEDEIVPRLHWDDRFDALAVRFDSLRGPAPTVGVHVHSETAQFYRSVKDWPADRWPRLFERVRKEVPARFVLFGSAPGGPLEGEGIVDLRGRTTLLEVLAIVLVHCDALVAPDSGILSLAYLLDAQRDLAVVSLWGDPRQGILKHRRPSPNARLRHHPLLGADEEVANISVDAVAAALVASLTSRAATAR
jgi:hypothetical protein